MRRDERPSSGVRRTTAALLVLAVLIAGAFSPLADAEFLAYDDPQYVSANQHVLEGLSLRGIAWALTSFEAANWHPLTWASHMLDVSLFGPFPEAHHLVNLGLHGAAALLFALLLKAATGALWPSILTAALFALHPLRVESVAWISERKDVLSILLGVLMLLAYVRYARRPGPGRYVGVTALLALGLAAKPMLVTLPALLLLLDWWPLGRMSVAGVRRGQLLLEKLPLLALTAASAAVTWLAQKRGGAVAAAEIFPADARIANAVVSYSSYLKDLVWPRDLIPFYRHPGLNLPRAEIILALALLAGISAGAVWARQRRPWILAGWLWYLVALVPVIGLVQVGLQGKADRYTYLPSLGLCAAISWEVASRGIGIKSAQLRAARGAAAAVVIATLSVLTWKQARLWKDTVTLFTRVVAVDPENYVAFNMLGSHYLLRGEAARAQEFFMRSLALKPGYLPARYNLALALSRRGERTDAIVQFTALILANPNDAESRYFRGNLLLEQGRATEALRDLDVARDLQPGQPEINLARGDALVLLGEFPEALDAFSAALSADPRSAEAHYRLGRTLDALRRPEEAVDHFRVALNLQPGYAEAHNNLGVILAELGRLDEARHHFEEAVRLRPAYAKARANLARVVREASAEHDDPP